MHNTCVLCIVHANSEHEICLLGECPPKYVGHGSQNTPAECQVSDAGVCNFIYLEDPCTMGDHVACNGHNDC